MVEEIRILHQRFCAPTLRHPFDATSSILARVAFLVLSGVLPLGSSGCAPEAQDAWRGDQFEYAISPPGTIPGPCLSIPSDEDLSSRMDAESWARFLASRELRHMCRTGSATPRSIREALERGADVNDPGPRGVTPIIHAAANCRDVEVIETLLDAGARIDPCPRSDVSVVVSAARNPNPEILRLLLARGADLNACGLMGDSPLMQMIAFGAPLHAIETLVDAGARLDTRSKRGWTAMHLAVDRRAGDGVLAQLLCAGGDVNIAGPGGVSPLSSALRANRDAADIALLLAAGAQVNGACDEGFTPLHHAAERATDPLVIRMLVEAGADTSATESGAGDTPCFRGVRANTSPEVVRELVRTCGGIARRDGRGMTLLHAAAANNPSGRIIEVLLKEGADIDARNWSDATPLHCAANTNSSLETLDALLSAGADPRRSSRAGPVLTLAVAQKEASSEYVARLIDAGASVTARDGDGVNALMAAVMCDAPTEVIRMLCERGAPCDEFVRGYTPLMVAVSVTSDPEVLRVLLHFGANPRTRSSEGLRAAEYVVHNRELEGSPAFELLRSRSRG